MGSIEGGDAIKGPASELPQPLLQWIAAVEGGHITKAIRHVARREAWFVDVTTADGSVHRYFLRLDRDRATADGPWSVRKEARVVEAISGVGLPVPAVAGWNQAYQAAIYERVEGREDLFRDTTAPQRWTILQQFMDYVARLHALDPHDLGLDDVLAWPSTSEEVALAEVDNTERLIGQANGEPLITFGLHWLRRHVPPEVERVTLVQGDTGPGNFLFDGDRLTAVVDFEWAHFGDPMEDLGHLRLRDFFFPSGFLLPALHRYEELAKAPIDLAKVRYYTIQPLLRSLIWLRTMADDSAHNPAFALNLAYLAICERAMCEAIADASGVALSVPDPLPDPPSGVGAVVIDNLKRQVLPSVQGDWAVHQLNHAALLVECIQRTITLQPLIDQCELDELGALLGDRPTGLREGLRALDRLIPSWSGRGEEAVLRYLARRAYRAEQLYAPVVDALFPGRSFTPLEL
jgi:aminoglycoside phosphotransferase (APT) family kinase protein